MCFLLNLLFVTLFVQDDTNSNYRLSFSFHKVELEVTQKKLDQAQNQLKRLKDKVDHLSSRPTHSK